MSLSMIFVAALVVGAAANASEPADSTFDRLMKVDKFAFGGIGEGGDISQGEQDFNVILSRRSALADFVWLYSNGTLQAKAYALVGIRYLSQTRFRELAQSMGDSKESVHRQSGCKSFEEPFEKVFQDIASGRYAKVKDTDAKP